MKTYFIITFLIFSCFILKAQNLPQGFQIETSVIHNKSFTGFEFDPLGRIYAFEKSGKIWFIKNDTISTNPIVDISNKTSSCCELGLMGIAFDPNFMANGYIYLAYSLHQDSIPGNQSEPAPTIGRVSRFTILNPSSLSPSIEINSELILIGSNPQDAWPITYIGHMGGAIAFGTDGSLILSTGDGSSFGDDNGSDNTSYFQKALDIGIITQNQNIGSIRSQELNSLSGKILRINPSTGFGMPDNPYFESNNPGSYASKIYARGLRNPWKMLKIPHTGNNSNPGKFLIGDVGSNIGEEINILENANENFGWPNFEGIDSQDFNRPNSPPVTWKKPLLSMRDNIHGLINGSKVQVGTPMLPGDNLSGNASLVLGDFVHDNEVLPEEFEANLFFGDFVSKNIYRTKFGANNNPEFVYKFATIEDHLLALRISPSDKHIYISTSNQAYNGTGKILRIVPSAANNKPTAKILLEENYGGSSFIICPDASLSFDLDGDSLSYFWELSDGQTALGLKPYFKVGDINNTNYNTINVKLTVTDTIGSYRKDSIIVHFNSQKPKINSITTSPNLNEYVELNSLNEAVFTANVSNPNSEPLSYKWEVFDSHNGHDHLVITNNNAQPTLSLPPIPCENGASYWILIKCTVTGPGGLFDEKDIVFNKNCSGVNQTITFNKPPDTTYNIGELSLNGISSSGLGITYYVHKGPGMIHNGNLEFNGKPGIIKLRATQNGIQNLHNVAPFKEHSIIIRKSRINPVINLELIPSNIFPTSKLKILGNSSTIEPLKYIVTSGPGRIIGDTLVIDTLGKNVTIKAYVHGTDFLNFGQVEKSIITCSNGLILSETPENNIYRSATYIKSSQNIINNLKYKAGGNIELLPGFKAPTGFTFEAKIVSCNEN